MGRHQRVIDVMHSNHATHSVPRLRSHQAQFRGWFLGVGFLHRTLRVDPLGSKNSRINMQAESRLSSMEIMPPGTAGVHIGRTSPNPTL